MSRSTEYFETLTSEEINSEISHLRKRFWACFGLGLIPGLNFVFMGCAYWLAELLSWYKSRGKYVDTGFLGWFMMLYGWFTPYIIRALCDNFDSIGNLVLGRK